MRVLLSTIGSRGDVQPLVALALALRESGHESRLVVPPDFREWIEGRGLAVTPIGPGLRRMTASPSASPPTPEQLRELAQESVAAQFGTVAEAAEGCDAIVAATALQIAARSVAEVREIPYVFAAYAPVVLPSPDHAPPAPAAASTDNEELWAADATRFNAMFGEALNAHRASLGLGEVDDVRGHVLGERPWLAADPTLAPWPGGDAPFQPGAWLLGDDRPLSPELEAFLDAGEPPVYLGLGSMRAPEELGRARIDAARAVARRAIVSQGWAELSLVHDGPDCLAVGEVNQQALFPRVAAVVHHGGAGTTTAAAVASTPQVVIPQSYDQPYWAERVEALGIGAAHGASAPSDESLTSMLEPALAPAVAERAAAVAREVRGDGARRAAERLPGLAGR